MSIMQDFRDGYSVRFKWASIRKILKATLACVLIVETIILYCAGDIQKATFTAVIVLWLST